MGAQPPRARWPAHLPVGALRVVRWSARYEETVTFYRDTIGLPVLDTFHDSGGLDGIVFYLPDAAALEHMQARLAAAGARPVAQIDYWQANGGVTYQDPDGREVVFASWIYSPPGS